VTQRTSALWGDTVEQVFASVASSALGLSDEEATQRTRQLDDNRLRRRRRRTGLSILLAQFKSPIILLLIGSAGLSFLLDDTTNAAIITIILVASSLLGWWQEWSAADAVARLLAVIAIRTKVVRDRREIEIPLDEVVPGDIVQLRAGDLIPGDCRIVESRDLFVDEAALTGETFPAEKSAGQLPVDTPLSRRTNSLFLGTHVVSGTANAVVVHTGKQTEFGRISERLEFRPPETAYERGLRNFGNLLLKVVLVFVVAVFGVNVYFHRPVVESLLFALALAVGMTPQLLPAITSVVLAEGAKSMAREQVIVKRLLSIENFGSMNVLCSDKTGTLTEGVVRLHAAMNVEGQPDDRALRLAFLNATLQTGFANPIDAAIRSFREFDSSSVRKLDEIPYDFLRKRLSILVDDDGSTMMITKGAFTSVIDACSQVETSATERTDIGPFRESLQRRFEELSDQGFRVLGLAVRDLNIVSGEEGGSLFPVGPQPPQRLEIQIGRPEKVSRPRGVPTQMTEIQKTDERNMTFVGFLVFFDPPKAGITETLRELNQLGVSLKIITGDNRVVAASIARQVGLENARVLTGGELRMLSDEALRHQAQSVNLFAEVEPNQKERIILALKKSGDVVGYMGDGINDASALHAADVGISVASAVEVAREAAQIVLLRHDLSVLVQGVKKGRATLANTLKYIFVCISGNFGYMFSMAVASLFLPFLPLLPAQILLINLLADFPAMALATDSVDPELIQRPRRWNSALIARFMLVFGLSGSIFDFLTFGVLRFVYRASEVQFRTGWFIESVMTGLIIMLFVRTKRPFFKSRPGRHLLFAAAMTGSITLALPFSPIGTSLEFVPPEFSLLLLIAVIAMLYGLTMEVAKWLFYRFLAAESPGTNLTPPTQANNR
jgi:P-type Mg2+ transporter